MNKKLPVLLTLAIIIFLAARGLVAQADDAGEGPAITQSTEQIQGGTAQAAVPATQPQIASADYEASTMTLAAIFRKGGWIMYVIAALSFLSIALAIFYFLTMRSSLLFPRNFILEAQDAAEGNDFETLKSLCDSSQTPAARIIAAALGQIVPGKPLNYDRLRSAMEDEGGRQASFLWQRLQYLMDVAVISPMVGLLGTVWGMMISFGGIENGAEFAKKAETLASGISQAMYTTFGGLIVGIFAMALYDILRGHLNRLVSSMESACGSVLARLDMEKPADGFTKD